ncbi:MAG: hypothetical protein OXT67_06310 [Zetaproteobacteria bacterium]|nr:hypothetical protein [Zetaproteobacteria bacterium]
MAPHTWQKLLLSTAALSLPTVNGTAHKLTNQLEAPPKAPLTQLQRAMPFRLGLQIRLLKSTPHHKGKRHPKQQNKILSQFMILRATSTGTSDFYYHNFHFRTRITPLHNAAYQESNILLDCFERVNPTSQVEEWLGALQLQTTPLPKQGFFYASETTSAVFSSPFHPHRIQFILGGLQRTPRRQRQF